MPNPPVISRGLLPRPARSSRCYGSHALSVKSQKSSQMIGGLIKVPGSFSKGFRSLILASPPWNHLVIVFEEIVGACLDPKTCKRMLLRLFSKALGKYFTYFCGLSSNRALPIESTISTPPRQRSMAAACCFEPRLLQRLWSGLRRRSFGYVSTAGRGEVCDERRHI